MIYKNLKKHVLFPFLLFLLFSILMELFFFNRAFFLSHTNKGAAESAFTIGEGLQSNDNGFYTIIDPEQAYIELSQVSGPVNYLYLDVNCTNILSQIPLTLRFALQDEGNSAYYELPELSYYPTSETDKYVRLHSYGDVHGLRIYFSPESPAIFSINSVIYNASVPFEFSAGRFLILFIIFSALWILRPASQLYQKQWSHSEKRICVIALITLNILIWNYLINLNDAFLNPTWPHHEQYYKLAVALTEGKVNIETTIEPLLSTLSNPYDPSLRNQYLASEPGWDTAFYEGKSYVYFGIVPVFLFYLPHYILFKNAFPTWFGILITGIFLLAGVYFLLHKAIKKWFPDTPFLIYLILCLITGNSIGTIPIIMRPDFYSLPILCGLCFTIWGLGLWVNALLNEENKRIRHLNLFLGSLCMALTAGCRPQFLIASFLIVPFLLQFIKKEKKIFIKKNLVSFLAIAVPYIIVATGVMYYNYIRFGSVFDFGANYNITTNDMTHRGFHLARIPDGIFSYLFQLPNINMIFPFVHPIPVSTTYSGITIYELIFGGIFCTHFFLLVLILWNSVKKQWKDKQLYTSAFLCLLSGLIVVIADTEMSGLLNRYCTDFLWAFFLVAIMVVLQLWESYHTTAASKWLILFLIISLFGMTFMQFSIGLQASELKHYNPSEYYKIQSFF